MKVFVEKQNERYIATITDYQESISKCVVTKSWDPSYVKNVNIPIDLLTSEIDLYDNYVDLLSISFELDKITELTKYYKIDVASGNLDYSFFVDYTYFLDYEYSQEIYFYEIPSTMNALENEKLQQYTFFLVGNYTDKHKVKIDWIKNNRFIQFRIPDKKILNSEFYYFEILLNNAGVEQTILKDTVGIETNKGTQFLYTLEDYGKYYKCDVFSKYPYGYLKSVTINDNVVKGAQDDIHLKYSKYSFSLFLMKGVKKDSKVVIDYTIQEDYLGALPQNKRTTLVIDDSKIKKRYEINNFDTYYDFKHDSLYFTWQNSFPNILRYKIVIHAEDNRQIGDYSDGTYIHYTEEQCFKLSEFKYFNNDSAKIGIDFYASINGDYFPIATDLTFENPYVKYKSTSCNVFIENREFLKSSELFAKINWSGASFPHYSKIKIHADFIKRFLNEFSEPWKPDEQLVLEQTLDEFCKTYPDLDAEVEYDFDENGAKSTKIKNGMISYDGINQDFVRTENDFYEVPKWYTNQNLPYTVTVQIYDLWDKLCGENSIQLSRELKTFPLQNKDIILNRNQKIQFGESGTIGEFFLKGKISPYETQRAYADEYKTYLEEPLFDESNIDFDSNSLYYYFNSKEENDILIKIQRRSNFFEVFYELSYDEQTLLKNTFRMKGNKHKDNAIRISRNTFKNEGVYIMNFKTKNFAGNLSETKQIKFFVYNTKPETPQIFIPPQDIYEGKEPLTINKKYFRIEVTNNAKSDRYAGWKFKEVHFFFKNKRDDYAVYNSFPDYVVQANSSDGKIILRNTAMIENSEYMCKVVAYDYAGNASEPYEFQFNVVAEIKITPSYKFTNRLEQQDFLWKILKTQDSDGFYYYLSYSADGIHYNDTFDEPHKVESPYYLNQSETSQEYDLKIPWLQDSGTTRAGFYKLVCYEFNYKHPNGLTEYKFESIPVEVNKTGNASEPIYAQNIKGSVKVFYEKQANEFAYTNDLNSVVFHTTHAETEIDDGTEKPEIDIKGQYYKLILIEPGTHNQYHCRLPLPKKVGNYSFTKIADLCKITSQIEGVWELRFITRDRLGNINDKHGYYTYYINLVKRPPRLTSAVHMNGNNSEYFGLDSTVIAFQLNENTYHDIVNYQEHIDKFKFSKIVINYLSNPQNLLRKIDINVENFTQDLIVKVRDNLTENNKKQHDLDGRYIINFQLFDPLERSSSCIEKTYYIRTRLEYDLLFLTPDRFISDSVKIVASTSENVDTVYYKFLDSEKDIASVSNEDYKKYSFAKTGMIEYESKQIFGFETEDKEYEENGNKILCYFVKENSGNISTPQFYKFQVDTTAQFIPLFDVSNKIYYNVKDEIATISWNMSHKDIQQFYARLDKIKLQDGKYIVEREYRIHVSDSKMFIEVSQEKNAFADLGNKRFFTFPIQDGGIFDNGHYMLTVRGVSKYGTSLENYFKFQIDKSTLLDLNEIKKNTITLDNNMISWTPTDKAESYEISYDGKNYISTKFNHFLINPDELIKEKDTEKRYVYLRYKTVYQAYSSPVKIEIIVDIKTLKKPIIIKETNIITDSSFDGWNVQITDPLVEKYIYYSFDNKNWRSQSVSGTITKIVKDGLRPFPDGTYDIFVYTTDRLIVPNEPYNKSETVHSSIELFNKPIPIPKLNVEFSEVINIPKNLYILNKLSKVEYYLFVNKRKVNEGFELSSSSQKTFKIDVKGMKKGTNEIVDLISNYEVAVYTPNTYIIKVQGEEIYCNINSQSNVIEIIQMPNKRNNQAILYKEKGNLTDNWKIVQISDTLSLEKEWEFKIVTFNVL